MGVMLGSCFDYFVSMAKSFLHAILYMLCSHLSILKVFSKLYISIHHEFAPGMYNYCFCNDFVINSSQLNVYEDLTYGFLAIGWNRDLILHLVPHLTLRSTLDPHVIRHSIWHAIRHSECIGAGGWCIGGL
jgi:hypothetical protein